MSGIKKIKGFTAECSIFLLVYILYIMKNDIHGTYPSIVHLNALGQNQICDPTLIIVFVACRLRVMIYYFFFIFFLV